MPYSPGQQYTGANYLAQSGMQAGANFNDLLKFAVERGVQSKQDRAALQTLATMEDQQNETAGDAMVAKGNRATALRNVIKAYSDNPDIGKAIQSLGHDQLEGIMHGMAINSAMQKANAENAELQARADYFRQYAQERQGEGQGASEFARNFGQLMAGGGGGGQPNPGAVNPMAPTGMPGAGNSMLGGFAGMEDPTMGTTAGTGASAPMDPALAAIKAFGMTSVMNPRAGGQVLDKLLPYIMGQSDPTKAQFFKPGDQPQTFGDFLRVPTGGNTSQLVFNPAKAGVPVAMHDEDGNLQGWSVTDPRGHSTFRPYKGGAKVKQMTDAQTGEPLPGRYVTEQGQPVDERTLLEKTGFNNDGTLMGIGTQGTKGTPAPRVTVKDSDGKQFTVPAEQLGDALKQGYTEVK
jgi:hypothetical protein